MKFPKRPPNYENLILEARKSGRLADVLTTPVTDSYEHWSKVRYREPPTGLSREEHWLALKCQRLQHLTTLPLFDARKCPHAVAVMPLLQELLHHIDLSCGSRVGLPAPLTDEATKTRYVLGSLMDEGIHSSLLEGAATTRAKAKALIQSGRKPRNVADWMVVNNFSVMRRIVRSWKDQPLTPELILQMHREMTTNTLEVPEQCGRLRVTEDGPITVQDSITGDVYHTPPPPDELEERMQKLCDYANGDQDQSFTHPVVRAIILHYWLAFDHPFVDGNGRTARALFYWFMLRYDYKLFEYISISTVILEAPAKYYTAFLHTQTDDNDLTYFILQQARVIEKAMTALHHDAESKAQELVSSQQLLKDWSLNHRQRDLISYALKHPGMVYSSRAHADSHNITMETARTDLKQLVGFELLLTTRGQGRQMILEVPADLVERIMKGPNDSSLSQVEPP
ncbi:MAG: Fic family protein [Verrucomicrobiales bacterium]|jgi:Fic family protein